MLNRRALLILIAVALAGQALALLPLPAVARTLGLLLFAAGVPGLLLADLLIGRSAQRPGALEFGLYGVAAGYALLTLGLLYLSYLPGALNSLHVLLAANLGLALLAALAWRKADNAPVTAGPPLYVPLSGGPVRAGSRFAPACRRGLAPDPSGLHRISGRRSPGHAAQRGSDPGL